MSKLLSDIRMDFGGVQTWVSQQWTQRVVQVSVYAAVVFFLLSNYSLIQAVEKSVKSVSGLKLGHEGTLVLHSVIFGLFMYVGTRFILDPILVKAANGVVEGQVGQLESEAINIIEEDIEQVADIVPATTLFGHLSLSKYRPCDKAKNILKKKYPNGIHNNTLFELLSGKKNEDIKNILGNMKKMCPEYND